jgi:predicted glutamine amidotransferase
MAAMKKTDPAWPEVSAMSCRIVGMSGEKMNRLMKVTKNTSVTKATLGATARNGWGLGQARSMAPI